MSAAYLAPPKPISLLSLVEPGPSKQPGLDLEWDNFQAYVESFLNAVDGYTADARIMIANLASEHQDSVRNLTADKEETERRIQQERTREAEMLQALESERNTLTELNASVGHLQASLKKVKKESQAVEEELGVIKKEVSIRRNEKTRQGEKLGEMSSRDDEELKMLEEVLGWRVDGVGQDKLLFRFKILDPAEPEKEHSIVMDISKQDYQVPACSPPLPNLVELVADLNTTRDLSTFIKRVRKSFKALVPTPQPPPSKFDTLSGPSVRTPAGKGVLSSTRPNGHIEDADMAGLKLQ